MKAFAELVGETTSHLVENVSLVVVAEGSGHFVVSHVGPVPVSAPEGGKGLGIVEPEHSFLLVLPGHHVGVGRPLQDLEGELPQLGGCGDVWKRRVIDQLSVNEIKTHLYVHTT